MANWIHLNQKPTVKISLANERRIMLAEWRKMRYPQPHSSLCFEIDNPKTIFKFSLWKCDCVYEFLFHTAQICRFLRLKIQSFPHLTIKSGFPFCWIYMINYYFIPVFYAGRHEKTLKQSYLILGLFLKYSIQKSTYGQILLQMALLLDLSALWSTLILKLGSHILSISFCQLDSPYSVFQKWMVLSINSVPVCKPPYRVQRLCFYNCKKMIFPEIFGLPWSECFTSVTFNKFCHCFDIRFIVCFCDRLSAAFIYCDRKTCRFPLFSSLTRFSETYLDFVNGYFASDFSLSLLLSVTDILNFLLNSDSRIRIFVLFLPLCFSFPPPKTFL